MAAVALAVWIHGVVRVEVFGLPRGEVDLEREEVVFRVC